MVDLAAFEHDFGAERRSGAALAPGAMADRHTQRLAGRRESNRAAYASAFMIHHRLPTSGRYAAGRSTRKQLPPPSAARQTTVPP